jgi:hypothetical protein
MMSPENQGVFPTPERSNFSSIYGILQLIKMGPFFGGICTRLSALLIGWWGWPGTL